MLVFPERMRVAHLAEGLPDLEHGRVGGKHVERLAWWGRLERRSYGLLAVGDDGANGKLRVLEAHGHVVGPDAADGERGGICFALFPGVGEHLEVHVPEPRDVPAVGVVVVYGYEDVAGLVASDKSAQDLIEAHGVLDQEQERLPVPRSHPLDPP